MKKIILIAGLNPTWQKTLTFAHLAPGCVNRARSLDEVASGKAVNFYQALRTWGKCDGLICQFAGGGRGDNLIIDQRKKDIPCRTVKIIDTTRCCTTVLSEDDSSMTELIEPSPSVTAAEAERLFDIFMEEMPRAAALALCGTYPQGLSGSYYAGLAKEAHKHGLFVQADAFQGMEETLHAGIDLLKINLSELKTITGETDTASAFRTCFTRYNVKSIAITDGAGKAILAVSPEAELIYLPVPAVKHPVNPLGCGDTCSAVMLSELLTGSDMVSAFRAGLAAASANCLTKGPAIFDKQTALKFLE